MGHFSFESVARGVPRDKLFRWYFDYSEDDVEIIRRRGDGSLLSRKVRREGGNRVIVENERIVRGKRIKMVYDANPHPENYTCEVEITVPGAYESHRQYSFTEVQEGTKVIFRDNYTVLSTRLKIADIFGVVRRQLARTSEQGMRAYIAEAEKELSEGKVDSRDQSLTL